jgi:hypothetical protein
MTVKELTILKVPWPLLSRAGRTGPSLQQAASLQLSLAWERWASWHLLSLFSGRVWLQSLHSSPGCANDMLKPSMVDSESSGSETNLVVQSAQYTCRAQMSSKESKKIVFHNAEPWYPAKFGLAKKPRRFFCVLRLQGLGFQFGYMVDSKLRLS